MMTKLVSPWPMDKPIEDIEYYRNRVASHYYVDTEKSYAELTDYLIARIKLTEAQRDWAIEDLERELAGENW